MAFMLTFIPTVFASAAPADSLKDFIGELIGSAEGQSLWDLIQQIFKPVNWDEILKTIVESVKTLLAMLGIGGAA